MIFQSIYYKDQTISSILQQIFRIWIFFHAYQVSTFLVKVLENQSPEKAFLCNGNQDHRADNHQTVMLLHHSHNGHIVDVVHQFAQLITVFIFNLKAVASRGDPLGGFGNNCHRLHHIVDKQQVLDLLAQLNKSVYDIMDESFKTGKPLKAQLREDTSYAIYLKMLEKGQLEQIGEERIYNFKTGDEVEYTDEEKEELYAKLKDNEQRQKMAEKEDTTMHEIECNVTQKGKAMIKRMKDRYERD